MSGLSLRLGLGARAVSAARSSGAPRGIVLSDSEVDDGAAVGALVGTLIMVGGTEPATFTLISNPDSLWAIDGDQLEVAASLAALGGTVESPVVRVTDALGQVFDAVLPITIAAAEGSNDSGIDEGDGEIVVPDPDDPESDGGGFDIPPVQQDTSEGLRVAGKNGGSATFLKDLGVPEAGATYAMKYSADWSGMSKQGRQAAVGFAFKSGNSFHLAGLRGDGGQPVTTMLASQIRGDFRKSNQFGVTNDGAAAHGSKDGPNWLQIVIAEDGSTYTLSSSADGETWTAEYTDSVPAPLAAADAALQFGPGGYFTNQDKGVFSITIETFEGLAPTDPHFANVVLLVGFDGTDAATTATDESPSGHTPFTFLANAQIDTAQSKFGGASLALDGTGDYVTLPDSTDWHFGSGQFTIEFWVRFGNTAVPKTLLSQSGGTSGTRGFTIDLAAGPTLLFGWRTAVPSNPDVSVSWNPSTDTWYHVAIDRDASNNIRMYVDGVAILTATAFATTQADIAETLRFGARGAASQLHVGWLDEVRITKGVARYASDAGFTAPTAAFPRS